MSDEKALRYNTDKLKWSLVHYKSLEPMVRVLMYGAEKYTVRDTEGQVIHQGENNWMKGLDKKEILESMQRHLAALMDGELRDPESSELHIGHIMCNALFWTYFHDKDNTNENTSTI